MRELMISRKLSKLDFNISTDKVRLYTYWCRAAYAEFESWTSKEHAHSFWELHLCLGGNAEIMSNGKEYTLTENTFVFLKPKIKHSFLSASDDYSEFVWGFDIEDKELDEMFCDKYNSIGVRNADSEMLGSVSLILRNAAESEFGCYDIIRNEIYHIFVLLARIAEAESGCVYYKTQNNQINMIKKFIRENLPYDTSIRDVSLFFEISENSIETMCKKEYNITFSQMKRNIRSEAVRELLEQTDYSMEEIAERTGFCDRYSMGKFFKKTEGTSPASYRRGIRK